MPKKHSVAGTALDPTIQFSTVEIDGSTFNLAYSFNAIAKAESVAGVNLLHGLESLTNLAASQLLGLFYAGLLVAQPDITIEQAGALIRLDTLAPITLALAEAYKLSLPEKKSNEPVGKPKEEDELTTPQI